MFEKLKVAVIGVGHLGKWHAQKLCELPLSDLEFIVDIDENRLKETARLLREKYGKKVKISKDFKEVLPYVSAVIIAVPTYNHYSIAKEVLLHKKALFLEKPMASTLEQAEELVEIAQKYNLPFQVGYIERYQSAVKFLLERVKKPLFIESHRLNAFAERNLDIDVILDLMIHDLDLVLLLKRDSKIDFIHAVGAPVFTDKIDIVNARIVFQDQTTCNLTASRISLNRQRKFRVFEKGIYYSVDTLNKTFVEIKPNPETKDFIIEKKSFSEDDPLKAELTTFVEGILKGSKVFPSGEEALLSLKIAFKIKNKVEEKLKEAYRI